ncbi:MAG: hypothetical protein Ta2E_09900 [Mycoplasmoidaceae bacterium]|nr:MAG: hypothetical protein Ta2E_09900 [Mycoplasmoidaceae bacterium]
MATAEDDDNDLAEILDKEIFNVTSKKDDIIHADRRLREFLFDSEYYESLIASEKVVRKANETYNKLGVEYFKNGKMKYVKSMEITEEVNRMIQFVWMILVL